MAWASSKGWLTKRSVPSTSPSSAIRTMVVLRRCRSIPTYCPIGASSSFRGFILQDRACSDLTRGGGPAPSSHQDEEHRLQAVQNGLVPEPARSEQLRF